MRVLRMAVAAFLVLHGVVHWIGFAVPWRLLNTEGFAYTTTAAWGQIDLGDGGTRAVAVLWLPVLAGFVAAGYGLWRGRSWWMPVTAGAAAVSLVLTILASPAAIIGLWIDVAILAVIAVIAVVRPAGARTLTGGRPA